MEIAKIVVGVDFSEQSDQAAAHAVQLARKSGAQVVLVHAGQIPELDVPDNEAAREWLRVGEARLAGNRARLEELRTRLDASAPGLSQVSHMVIDGYADVGLCEAGVQLGADLLAVGTHGRTGMSRFLMGSVAERVVRHFPGHVLVVRHSSDDSAGGPVRYRKILIPTDFSAQAEAALRLALSIVEADGRIDLFHAWDTPPELALEWTGPILDELAGKAQESGHKLLMRYARPGVQLTFECERAQPVVGIQDRMNRASYDLVVMGSHGRRGLKRFLLGSVAEKVVRHAPCSVLVAHKGDD